MQLVLQNAEKEGMEREPNQLQLLPTKGRALCPCSLNFVILTCIFTSLYISWENVLFSSTSKVGRSFYKRNPGSGYLEMSF